MLWFMCGVLPLLSVGEAQDMLVAANMNSRREDVMSKLAQVGDFYPHSDCADYGKRRSEDETNVIKSGKTKAGRQRFQCKTCGGTLVETKGTIFYRRRTPDDEIIETLAFIAEGSRISSAARVKGHKKETIIDWIQDAGDHAEAIEDVLLADYQIERGQLDGL